VSRARQHAGETEGRGHRIWCWALARFLASQQAFKAIPGHEYGHFSNRDTAGGQMATAVRGSLHARHHRGGQAGGVLLLNPAGISSACSTVYSGASPGCLALARDHGRSLRGAAYGPAAFAEGLTASSAEAWSSAAALTCWSSAPKRRAGRCRSLYCCCGLSLAADEVDQASARPWLSRPRSSTPPGTHQASNGSWGFRCRAISSLPARRPGTCSPIAQPGSGDDRAHQPPPRRPGRLCRHTQAPASLDRLAGWERIAVAAPDRVRARSSRD